VRQGARKAGREGGGGGGDARGEFEGASQLRVGSGPRSHRPRCRSLVQAAATIFTKRTHLWWLTHFLSDGCQTEDEPKKRTRRRKGTPGMLLPTRAVSPTRHLTPQGRPASSSGRRRPDVSSPWKLSRGFYESNPFLVVNSLFISQLPGGKRTQKTNPANCKGTAVSLSDIYHGRGRWLRPEWVSSREERKSRWRSLSSPNGPAAFRGDPAAPRPEQRTA
jgi:hypothetical protein